MNNAVFFMGSPNVSGRNLIGYNITILFITKRVHEKKGRLKTELAPKSWTLNKSLFRRSVQA
ncbi:hypothetical protein QP713_09965, partial [Neisseria mucosa]